MQLIQTTRGEYKKCRYNVRMLYNKHRDEYINCISIITQYGRENKFEFTGNVSQEETRSKVHEIIDVNEGFVW